MTAHPVRLLVLSLTKVGEKGAVVHTLSEPFGRRGFLVHLGRQVPPSLFLPLNLLDGEVVENPRSDLWTLRQVQPAHPLNGIRNNLYKNTMTLFLAEVLYRTVREGTYEDGLYTWCEQNVLLLNELNTDFSNFHLRFLLDLAGALGFRPTVGDLAPFTGDRLPLLRPIVTGDMASALLVPLSGEQRNALCDDLIRYLEYHTESTLVMRSLSVLRELYRDE